MKANRPNLLASLLQNLFSNHLCILRGMSPQTIQSYRDSLVLLLRFLASHKNRPASSLDLADLGPQETRAFLVHLESERRNSASPRNIRLSALYSFFRFVAAQHPDRLERAQRILGIPLRPNIMWSYPHVKSPLPPLQKGDFIVRCDPRGHGG
jgi:integrase/recombinase XerD